MEFKGTKVEWVVDGEHITTGYDNISETICDINPNTEYPSVHERSTIESKANAKLIAHAPEMLKKHYEEIEILEDIFKNNPIGDVAFKLRMIIESKKDLLTRATTI